MFPGPVKMMGHCYIFQKGLNLSSSDFCHFSFGNRSVRFTMKVQQMKKLAAYKSVDVRAFVSPKSIAKKCRICKQLNLTCSCLKPSPLLSRKERSAIVLTKSWLLGWIEEDVESDSNTDADTVSILASSCEEESEAEQSFVFPEVDDRERFNDSTLVSDEEGDEIMADLDSAFVEAKRDDDSEDSGSKLPSFACLVELLRS